MLLRFFRILRAKFNPNFVLDHKLRRILRFLASSLPSKLSVGFTLLTEVLPQLTEHLKRGPAPSIVQRAHFLRERVLELEQAIERGHLHTILGIDEDYLQGTMRNDILRSQEAARCFLSLFRSVWRIARPLDATWNIFNPSRDKISLQHWGGVISPHDRFELEKKLSEQKKSRDAYLGEIHQLKRDGKGVLYDFRELSLRDVDGKTVWTYVGLTILRMMP
jgi:hypothetical protein